MSREPRKFDVAVLGGGPGGYPAAIRAAQKGRSVALIEAKEVGGTCLNRGCIPTKTLIANADVWERIHHAEEFGISVGQSSFDFGKMTKRKDRIVEELRKSLEGLIASNKITLVKGFGKFISPQEIKVMGQDNEVVYADNVVIATGSEPRKIEAFPFDYKRIHDSTSIMTLTTLPKSLVIIGGGVIGVEFASLYATLGVEITILELMPTIIPTEDKFLASELAKSFHKRGIKIQTNVNVQKIETSNNGVKVLLADGKFVEADMALVSVGRSLNTENIDLDKAGVVVNEKGFIPVNDRMETNVKGIYAIGDITAKWLLAHVATHQGIVAANNICGEASRMHYNAIPSIIFTHPEIGTVGMTLDQATKAGYQAQIAAFPFQNLGKSKASAQTEGFAQIVVDKKSGQILGAQMIGFEAATLIAEMGLAIANELTVESITETVHGHPTIAEAWMEAAYMASGFPVHLPPKVKRG